MSDIALAGVALTLLAFEFTADNQQYAFQTYKHAFLKTSTIAEPYDPKKQWPGARLNWTPADAKRGFITKGLWAYARHPNFLCEQCFWWVINLIPLLSPNPPHLIRDTWLRSLAGLGPSLALSALFFSSTAYTEAITKNKYPDAYAAYQTRVGTFSPLGTWEKKLICMYRGKRESLEAKIWGDAVADEKKD